MRSSNISSNIKAVAGVSMRLTMIFGVTAGALTGVLSTKHDVNFSTLNPIPSSHASHENVITYSKYKKPSEFRAKASWLVVESREQTIRKEPVALMEMMLRR